MGLRAHASRTDRRRAQEAEAKMAFSVTGLASGLDTSSIINQLMAVDGRGKTRLEWNKALWEARKSTWNDLNGKLNSLQGFADILNQPGTWTTAAATSSSDPTKLTGTVTGSSPAAGTYTINIASLAVAEVWDGANSVSAGADDTLSVLMGVTQWDVPILNGDSIDTMVSKINGTSGIGVTASNVAGKLHLVANATGAASDFTVFSSGTLAADLGMAETTAGGDASFDINATPYTRSTNLDLTGLVNDVSIDLLATTAGPVTLIVTADQPADATDIKSKIMDFVGAYNTVIELINAKTGEAKVASPKTLTDYLKGPLSRDYMMSSVGYDLRRWSTDVVNGLPDGLKKLADIGISTGSYASAFSSDNISGKLVVNETKLESAIQSDPYGVKEIFTRVGGGGTSNDGVSRRISSIVSGWRVGGKVDIAIDGAGSQITRLQGAIDRAQQRLDRRRSYYETMFASLESALGRMQTQGTWLSGQLASLTGASQFAA